jgi:nucleoside-diphosphate-sugar epimerase
MPTFASEADLDAFLSTPYPEDVEAVQRHPGDFLLLGAGGKMGPTLALRIARAIELAGTAQRVFAASRFQDPLALNALQHPRIQTLSANLLDEAALAALPDCPNVVFLAGRKFGSAGDPSLTWAMNVYLPALVAQRFSQSRIVALSSGNIYPFSPAAGPGPSENSETDPIGEYAQTVRGRERMFTYFAAQQRTPTVLIRLNYAVEPRYGILSDIGQRILKNEPIDLSMAAVNCIWQGDANSVILRSLSLCAAPSAILNLTGPETLQTQALAEAIAKRLERPVSFTGMPSPNALLSNAARCVQLFGPPRTSTNEAIDHTCTWLREGGRLLGKPTHFEARDGRF